MQLIDPHSGWFISPRSLNETPVCSRAVCVIMFFFIFFLATWSPPILKRSILPSAAASLVAASLRRHLIGVTCRSWSWGRLRPHSGPIIQKQQTPGRHRCVSSSTVTWYILFSVRLQWLVPAAVTDRGEVSHDICFSQNGNKTGTWTVATFVRMFLVLKL